MIVNVFGCIKDIKLPMIRTIKLKNVKFKYLLVYLLNIVKNSVQIVKNLYIFVIIYNIFIRNIL